MIKTQNPKPIYESLIKDKLLLLNSFSNTLEHDYNYAKNTIDIFKVLSKIDGITQNDKAKETISHYSQIIKKLTPQIEDKDNIINAIQRFKTYLKNLDYDTITQMPIIKPMSFNVVYEKDNNSYQYVNKQNRYTDISIRQVLKVLCNTHKINTFEYKNTIKRLNNGQQIKPKVQRLINCYLHTLKAHSNKNSMTALKRKADIRNFEILKYGGNAYKVYLKNLSIRQVLKVLCNTHKINTFEYKNTIKRLNSGLQIKPKVQRLINCYLHTKFENQINEEFKTKIETQNKIVLDITQETQKHI